MRRYDTYKDSGIQWIGQVPSHWEVKRLKSIVALITTASDKNEKIGLENIESFTGNFIGAFGEYESNGIEVRPGDIVYGKLRPYLCKAWLAEFACNAVGDFYVFRNVDAHTSTSYLHQTFLSPQFTEICNSSTYGAKMPRVSSDFILSLRLPVPPLSEQKAITDFLKVKTTKIEQYVSERERERELLESLKQAEIAKAVTQGLDPNVPMKDSGIPWIGMIPEHWETRMLSQMSRIHYISNKNVHNQNLLSLSYGKIVNKDINTTEGLLPASFDGYQIVETGNIVLRLTDLQNDHKSLRVGLAMEEGIITSAYLALQVYQDIIPKYLYFLLHSIDIKKVFYSMGNGLRQSLNWSELRKLRCILPPPSEQQAIVEYIETKLSKIDTFIADLQAEIDYLKEFKQRLISDAVTGQIKVTE